MIRNSLFIMAILGTAATALASAKLQDRLPHTAQAANTAVFQDQDIAPPHRIVLEKCALEDCSDTQS